MQIPSRLQSLVNDGLVDAVIRPLMSGKEASVLIVLSEGELRCAKVYKEANERNFRNRAGYEEGRGIRNTRSARAMGRRSRFGKQELEAAWQTKEVDTLHLLAHAGVRVPTPHVFVEGVLIMELVVDAEGNAAPRLNDVSLTPEMARKYHAFMLNQIVRMLCAGIIHGDLSEYNVLVDRDGPVVIDFPQAVDAAANNSAKKLLLRDVGNMADYFAQFAPELKRCQHGKEIWRLYERGELDVDAELTGEFEESSAEIDVAGVMRDISDAREDHERRTGTKGEDVSNADQHPETTRPGRPQPGRGNRGAEPRGSSGARNPSGSGDSAGEASANAVEPVPQKRRRRRRGRGRGGSQAPTQARQPSGTGQGQGAVKSHENRSTPRPASRADTSNPRVGGAPNATGEDGAPPRRRRRRRRKKPPTS